MKKEVISYFIRWLNYYHISDDGTKKVMEKVEELFKTYDELIQSKVTGEWKTQRKNLNKKD